MKDAMRTFCLQHFHSLKISNKSPCPPSYLQKKTCGVHEMIVINKSVIFLLVECVGIALWVLYCYVVPLYLFLLRNDFILYKIWLDGRVAHMRVWPLLLCLHVNGPTEQTVTPISVCYEKKIMLFVIFLHCFIHFNLFV